MYIYIYIYIYNLSVYLSIYLYIYIHTYTHAYICIYHANTLFEQPGLRSDYSEPRAQPGGTRGRRVTRPPQDISQPVDEVHRILFRVPYL